VSTGNFCFTSTIRTSIVEKQTHKGAFRIAHASALSHLICGEQCGIGLSLVVCLFKREMMSGMLTSKSLTRLMAFEALPHRSYRTCILTVKALYRIGLIDAKRSTKAMLREAEVDHGSKRHNKNIFF
jgi:hypothetical protein